jgi:serine/threonine-protein phosphatase with EF-hand domain
MGCGGSTDAGGARPPIKVLTPEERKKALEKEAETKLYRQKEMLRQKSLPMIETRSSCEDLLSLADQADVNAAYKLQLAEMEDRIQQDKLQADAQKRWMVFSNLDVVNEADMVHLMQFMKAAMKNVPTFMDNIHDQSLTALNAGRRTGSYDAASEENGSTHTKNNGSESTSHDAISASRLSSSDMITAKRQNSIEFITALRSLSTDSISRFDFDDISSNANSERISASRQNSVESIFRIDKIAISKQDVNDVTKLSARRISDFTLPVGFVTPAVAEMVVNLYRRDGKVNMKSVHKILRLSYRTLKKMPNITYMEISGDEKLTVVGDIHGKVAVHFLTLNYDVMTLKLPGQLQDLLHIIEESGMPSAKHKYLFNGDFVDRGKWGVEVMILILVLFNAFPNCVFLNRGNHEDFPICCAYGFQAECCRKYNDVTFGMFVEMFNYVPLFTIINNAVFVTHGGLFHCQDVTLAELNQIHRYDFSLKDLPEGGEAQEHIPRANRTDFLKQLQRDALWSDPADASGCFSNPRGAGVAFGPDVVRKFLQINNLQMVVRSHECVRTGFDTPYTGDDAHLLCTVFSASNYGEAANTAAYMVFTCKGHTGLMAGIGSVPVEVPNTDLRYSVFYFDLSDKLDDEETKTVICMSDSAGGLSMYGLVLQHKSQLEAEFKKFDPQQTGLISKMMWTEAMQNVLRLHVHWASLCSVIVPKHCLVQPEDCAGAADREPDIDYMSFLRAVSASVAGIDDLKDEEENDEIASVALLESLYTHHRQLEAVFRWFAGDHAGVISHEGFRKGCELLNQSLPPENQIKDVDKLLQIMDVSKTGEIDVNEFFEMFRLSDSKGDISATLPPPPPPMPLAARPPSPLSAVRSPNFKVPPLSIPTPNNDQANDSNDVIEVKVQPLLSKAQSFSGKGIGQVGGGPRVSKYRGGKDEIIDLGGSIGSVAVGISAAMDQPRQLISSSPAETPASNTDSSIQLDI